MAFSLPERGPRLGIEADDAFLADVRPRLLQLPQRRHQGHLALVAADGQVRQIVFGNGSDKVKGGSEPKYFAARRGPRITIHGF
jgi:hypothetical protein